MKILLFKNSILLLRVRPENKTVDCYFIFFISWNCFISEDLTFSFKDITMTGIKQFYKTLANDWRKTYRL